MKSFISLFLILTMITCSSGCLLMGKNKEYQPFDASGLDQLTPGQTTASEVTAMLGAPTQVVKLSNGNAYIYKRSLSKGTGLWLVIVSFGNYDKDYDQLVFFFDQDDVLRHYGVSLNARKASYGLPF
jgi:outer membrane protein assembly factor BamE (lipoprotein component of BamABCDE complex)